MSLGGAVHALVVCFASDDEETNLQQFWNLSYMETGSTINAQKLDAGDKQWAIKASEVGDDEDEVRSTHTGHCARGSRWPGARRPAAGWDRTDR